MPIGVQCKLNFGKISLKRLTSEWVTLLRTITERNQKENFTAVGTFIPPRIELAIGSMNTSSGRDAASVAASLECGERIGVAALFVKISERNNTFHDLNTNVETRGSIPSEVSQSAVPGWIFDRQSHTFDMLTGYFTPTNHFLPGNSLSRILSPHKPLLQRHHNVSTQVSQDNTLPKVEHTTRHQNSGSTNSISRLVDVFAGIAIQQRP